MGVNKIKYISTMFITNTSLHFNFKDITILCYLKQLSNNITFIRSRLFIISYFYINKKDF